VIYGREATFARQREAVRKLKQITEQAANRAGSSLVRYYQQAWFDNMVQEFIASQLIWNCLTAKSDSFQDERETRYIIMGERRLFDQCRHSRG
jgi:hypothetical protein